MTVTYDTHPCQSVAQWVTATRGLKMTWPGLLSELIDNACDFGARKVVITVNRKPPAVKVEDDGEGAPDPSYLLTPGKHGQPQHCTRPRIGLHAVGGKEAMVNAADEVMIVTYHGGMQREVFVSYPDLIRRNSWQIDAPDPEPWDGPSGVRIALTRLVLSPPDIRTLVESLGATYAPGISRGQIQLIVHPDGREAIPVSPRPDPDMDHIQFESTELPGGRRLEMRAGIIRGAAERRRQGVSLALGYRVMASRLRLGTGDRPTPGLYIFCQLSGSKWQATRHKTGVSERDEADIARAIAGRFADLIALAQRQGEDIELREVNNVLAGLRDTAQQIVKREGRKRKNRPRDDEPTGPSHQGQNKRPRTQQKRAKNTQPGNLAMFCPEGSSRGIQLNRQELGADYSLLSMDGDYIVILNTDHPGYLTASAGDIDHWGVLAVMTYCAHLAQRKYPMFVEQREWNYDRIVSIHLQSYFECRQMVTGGMTQVG